MIALMCFLTALWGLSCICKDLEKFDEEREIADEAARQRLAGYVRGSPTLSVEDARDLQDL